jgi:hypothetical protein
MRHRTDNERQVQLGVWVITIIAWMFGLATLGLVAFVVAYLLVAY